VRPASPLVIREVDAEVLVDKDDINEVLNPSQSNESASGFGGCGCGCGCGCG